MSNDSVLSHAQSPSHVTRTYLQMHSPAQLSPGDPPVVLPEWIELKHCTSGEWRSLYRSVGGPWQWQDRHVWSDEQLIAHLAKSDVRIFRIDVEGPAGLMKGAGFVELERHGDRSVEIAYLGLDLRVLGLGLGRWLVTRAVKEAWAWDATRVWLHTCTLDAPAALPNYLARGFEVERTEEYERTSG